MPPRASRVESRLECGDSVPWPRTGRPRRLTSTENGEARIDLHELPSGRRLISWPAATHATPGDPRCRFSPDGRSLFGTVDEGDPLSERQFFLQIWDTGHGQPISPPMASTPFSIYAPAGDRLLTNTNNLWLSRRAADGQARGSGFPRVMPSDDVPTSHPDGLHGHQFASRRRHSACGRSPRMRSRSRRNERKAPR